MSEEATRTRCAYCQGPWHNDACVKGTLKHRWSSALGDPVKAARAGAFATAGCVYCGTTNGTDESDGPCPGGIQPSLDPISASIAVGHKGPIEKFCEELKAKPAEPKLSKIAEDSRGASWSLTFGDDQEVVLLFSKAGALRGGHSHSVREVSMVLSGSVEYLKQDISGKESKFVQTTGKILHNAPGEPHFARFLEDSWLIDLRPGSKASDRVNTNFPEYRDLIDAQLKREKK